MKRSPLAVIFLTIFIDLLGIGILIPVIPQLLANPASPDYLLPHGVSLSQGYFLLGLLTAGYPIAQFLAAPILGQLSDRYGRKPILMISLIGTVIGYLLFGFAILLHNIPLLFASRILDGITGGNISVAQAVIADVSTPQNRSRNFGLVGAAFGLGFILGPYIGGQLADPHVLSWFNASTPFWFAAGLTVVNIVSMMFLLAETNTRRTGGKIDWEKSLHDIKKALTMPRLKWLFIVYFIFISGFSFFTTLFGVYLINRFGFDQASIGNLFAYIGIWIAITQGLITPLIAKRWKEWIVVAVTLFGMAIALLLFLLPGPWMLMLVTVPIFSVFNGVCSANFMALISNSAKDDAQGEVLGLTASVAALSQSLPPILSGIMAALLNPSATMALAAAIVIFAGVVFLMTVKRETPVAAHG